MPAADPTIFGTARRRPEEVGEASNTAWKNRGTLNKIVLEAIPPRKFAATMFATGGLVSRRRGITGCLARRSMKIRDVAATMKTAKDVSTTVESQGKMFPPKF